MVLKRLFLFLFLLIASPGFSQTLPLNNGGAGTSISGTGCVTAGTSILRGDGASGCANVGETGSGLVVLQTSPTITTPTIASFTNATHTHTNVAGGGQITDAAFSAAVTASKGGTGATTLLSHGLLVGNGTGIVNTVAVGATGTCLSGNTGADPTFINCVAALASTNNTWTGINIFQNTFGFDVSTPAQITSSQNNYALSAKTYIRLSSNGSYNITGIVAPTGNPYEWHLIKNINTTGNFVFQHQNASSSAANRIVSQTGADMTVQPNDMVVLLYDTSEAAGVGRWTVSKIGISPTTVCAAGNAGVGVDSSGNSVSCFKVQREPSGNGIVVRSAADTSVNRTMSAVSASRVVITFPDGVSGNPTWDVGPSAIDNSLYGCTTAGASGTTYTCNLTLAPSGYVTHALYHFKADVANSAGPVTINFNSLGAKTIKKNVSTDLAANEWQAGAMVAVWYDGTNMQLLAGSGGSSGVCGSNKYVQFNDSGVCGGVTGFQFDKATNIATLTGGIVIGAGPYAIFDASAIATTDKTITIRNLAGTMALTSDLVFTSITGTATTAQLPAANNFRPCEVPVGDPGAASSVLANDNDSPGVCANKTGATLTITAVECYADAGSPTVTPIITGGGATSILTGALTCGTGSFASGTLNGTPTQSNNGTIDANITAAGGTAKYIVIRITRTL